MIKTLVTTVLIGGAIGAVNGLIWALGVNAGFVGALILGSVIGAIACTIIAAFGVLVAASSGGKIAQSEAAVVSGNTTTLLGIACAILGIIVWVVRIATW